MCGPVARPALAEIAPYIPGKAGLATDQVPHRLASNESALGTSPHVLTALGTPVDLSRYPQDGAPQLRATLGDLHGIDPDRIICGCGSDEILSLAASAFLGPGDEAIYCQFGFLMYRTVILAAGARPVMAREAGRRTDIDAILACVGPDTRAVFLANPNNPTGACVSAGQIRRLHRALPDRVLLVLDAAYAEYVQDDSYESGLRLADGAPNVLVTRTFSKIYGLAALRLGWGCSSAPVIDALGRVRNPFNVSVLAQKAGRAALLDQDFVRRSVDHNTHWRSWLAQKTGALGLGVTADGEGNFVTICFAPRPDAQGQAKGQAKAQADGAARARRANRFLQDKQILVRALDAYGMADSLRVSVGSEKANRDLVEALGTFCAAH